MLTWLAVDGTFHGAFKQFWLDTLLDIKCEATFAFVFVLSYYCRHFDVIVIIITADMFVRRISWSMRSSSCRSNWISISLKLKTSSATHLITLCPGELKSKMLLSCHLIPRSLTYYFRGFSPLNFFSWLMGVIICKLTSKYFADNSTIALFILSHDVRTASAFCVTVSK